MRLSPLEWSMMRWPFTLCVSVILVTIAIGLSFNWHAENGDSGLEWIPCIVAGMIFGPGAVCAIAMNDPITRGEKERVIESRVTRYKTKGLASHATVLSASQIQVDIVKRVAFLESRVLDSRRFMIDQDDQAHQWVNTQFDKYQLKSPVNTEARVLAQSLTRRS